MISSHRTWREIRLWAFLGSEHRELGRWQSSSICFWVRRNFRLTLLKLPGSIASEQNCPVFATGSSTLAVWVPETPSSFPSFSNCATPQPPPQHPTPPLTGTHHHNCKITIFLVWFGEISLFSSLGTCVLSPSSICIIVSTRTRLVVERD